MTTCPDFNFRVLVVVVGWVLFVGFFFFFLGIYFALQEKEPSDGTAEKAQVACAGLGENGRVCRIGPSAYPPSFC